MGGRALTGYSHCLPWHRHRHQQGRALALAHRRQARTGLALPRARARGRRVEFCRHISAYAYAYDRNRASGDGRRRRRCAYCRRHCATRTLFPQHRAQPSSAARSDLLARSVRCAPRCCDALHNLARWQSCSYSSLDCSTRAAHRRGCASTASMHYQSSRCCPKLSPRSHLTSCCRRHLGQGKLRLCRWRCLTAGPSPMGRSSCSSRGVLPLVEPPRAWQACSASKLATEQSL